MIVDNDVDLTGEVVELLQHMIRNACVNDGSAMSGQEVRNAKLLQTFLEDAAGPGYSLDMQCYEPTSGRTSLVTRVEGTDPTAPSLALCGHTDVVPVSPAGWRHDPFGGELVDGEVWGRGAVDMLNLTAAMAVTLKHLARKGWRPRGTLVYLAVADEEAGGAHGAGWLVDNHWDVVGTDYLLTEWGGIVVPSHGRDHVSVTVAEKGVAWRRLQVRGTPGHGSMPFGADNALIKAAEVVRRLSTFRPKARISDTWKAWLGALDVPDDLRAALADPDQATDACTKLAQTDPNLARSSHACTHMTFSPNVIHGGVKTNVIPDVVDIDVDVRTLPGETADDVAANIAEALGDLAPEVEVVALQNDRSTRSPTDTPLWDAVAQASHKVYPEATLVPRLTTGGSDARFFRHRGTVAYGAALFSRRISLADFSSRFHGHDERVDVESLGLTARFYLDVVSSVLG
jgi:acetylornithine deacetylase/succinyl-diaminopimelate desuccinylase-like protein